MKKLLILIVLIFMVVAVSGCDRKRVSDETTNFERFVVIKTVAETGNTVIYEVYDKDTSVMYFLTESISYSGYLSYNLCPMYGTDGKVAIYAWSNPN